MQKQLDRIDALNVRWREAYLPGGTPTMNPVSEIRKRIDAAPAIEKADILKRHAPELGHEVIAVAQSLIDEEICRKRQDTETYEQAFARLAVGESAMKPAASRECNALWKILRTAEQCFAGRRADDPIAKQMLRAAFAKQDVNEPRRAAEADGTFDKLVADEMRSAGCGKAAATNRVLATEKGMQAFKAAKEAEQRRWSA
jgi:hypothetical protein